MKAMLRAIAKAMRAMRRAAGSVIRKVVEIGGRLVTVFLPAPMPMIDELEADEAPANDNTYISENQGIRDLAYCQLHGRMPTPAQLGAVTGLQMDWVAAMDSEMARRLLKATDREINAHLRGIKSIRGVIECNEDAVDDYVTATAINAAILERDLNLEQHYEPRKMPA